MACVEASIPVPNTNKKTDELFIYWLSEPSTQELLRKELAKISGNELDEKAMNEPQSLVAEYPNFLSPSSAAVTSVLRPGSPNVRTPSPPLLSHRSPKSPRGSARIRSPKKTSKSPSGAKLRAKNGLQHCFDEVDGASGEDGVLPAGANVHLSARCQLEKAEGIDSLEILRHHSNGSGRRSRSPSPKPETLPTGAGVNHVLKPPNSSGHIPRFYFPHGKPQPEEDLQERFAELSKWFQNIEGGEADFKQLPEIMKILRIPLYWKAPLFKACLAKEKDRETVTFQLVKKAWQRVTHNCHDTSSRFVRLLATNGCNYLVEEDLEVLVQDVVDSHPGLQFLSSTPEFHARYIETVIGRIFYVVDRNWNGRINAGEIRRSNLLQTLVQLEEEPDINQITDFFSYEHFYVIYCKFWELDSDHDLEIDKQDLSRHADQALTQRIINRVMSGVVSRRSGGMGRNKDGQNQRMGYKDFIWFLLSEEDKTSPRSIEYWFRCMDLDGDGVLSLFEMVYFYEEVLQRLQEMNIDCLSVENTVCQILDMVNPKNRGNISLRDLKSCKMTPVFFNTFINVDKYLEYEQRDPVVTAKEEGSEETEPSDWDRYASEQYELLLQEEQYEQENTDFEETEASDLEEDEKEMLDFLR